jgi:hypothetical protein
MNWGNYVVSVKKDLILYFLAPAGITPADIPLNDSCSGFLLLLSVGRFKKKLVISF